jgi:hypothetical protein
MRSSLPCDLPLVPRRAKHQRLAGSLGLPAPFLQSIVLRDGESSSGISPALRFTARSPVHLGLGGLLWSDCQPPAQRYAGALRRAVAPLDAGAALVAVAHVADATQARGVHARQTISMIRMPAARSARSFATSSWH